MVFLTHKNHSKRFSATFLVTLIVMLISISVVSASTWTSNLNTDLIAYYNLSTNEDAVGSLDLSNRTGTYATGLIGNALSNDYIYGDGATFNIIDTDSSGNFSMCLWTNSSSAGSQGTIYLNNVTGSDGSVQKNSLGFGHWNAGANWQGAITNQFINVVQSRVNWQFHCLIFNGTTRSYYRNTVLSDSSVTLTSWTDSDNVELLIGAADTSGGFAWDGLIDEVGFWNRDLTSTELTALYNSGAGLTYVRLDGITVTLSSPADGLTVSDTGSNFTASYSTTTNYSLTNATYYVWNDTGIFNDTVIVYITGTSNSTTEFIDDFILGDYEWNVWTCYENVTFNNCSFSSSNNSFSVIPFSAIAESFVNSTVEGSTETFTLNVSVLTGFRISAIDLIYNNTAFSSDFTEYDTNEFSATFDNDIPLVTADVNMTFFWNITLENGFSQTTTTHNQTVNNLVFDDCSAGTYLVFNFTMLDETDQSFLTGGSQNTSMNIDLTISRLNLAELPFNFSQAYAYVNPAQVCTNVDLGSARFRADAIIKYESLNRFSEFYNIQNYTLTNSTTNNNINLYNLNSSLGQEFKITYKDQNFELVPGAIIQIQRQYIDEGVFKTIEIPLISSAGYTIAHLIRSDAIYNLIILKDGKVLDSFTNIVANCQNPTFTDCEININSFATGISPEDFTVGDDFSTTLTYDRTTRLVSATYVIPSGVSATTTLNVTLFDALGTSAVCADSLFAAGGTLSCTVPIGFGNESSIMVKIFSGGEEKVYSVMSVKQDPADLYGGSLIFLAVTILLLIVGMSVTDNPMVLGFMLIVGLVILSVLNLVYTTSWIGKGATLLWFVVAVIIVLVKGSNRQ